MDNSFMINESKCLAIMKEKKMKKDFLVDTAIVQSLHDAIYFEIITELVFFQEWEISDTEGLDIAYLKVNYFDEEIQNLKQRINLLGQSEKDKWDCGVIDLIEKRQEFLRRIRILHAELINN